ncbi:putative leader peptide [Phycicoccus sp. Soil803]
MKDNGSRQRADRSCHRVLRRHVDLLRVSSALCHH